MTSHNATFSLEPLNLINSWRAAQVTRFHAEDISRSQSVGEHQWGVALICLWFWPERPQLIKVALLHDVPEKILGDSPHPSKAICIDEEREREAEDKLLHFFYPNGLSEALDVSDLKRIKIDDMMEFVFYVQREVLMGNSLARGMLEKGTELTMNRIYGLPPHEINRVSRGFESSLQEFENGRSRYA